MTKWHSINASTRVAEFLLFLTISLAARGLYIFLFHNCSSFDLKAWDDVGDILMAGENPYHLTTFISWPPFWMQVIFIAKKISLTLHVPFIDVIRVVLITAESAMALVLYIAGIRYAKSANILKLLIFGIALNPISIFLVCQHCNFDVFLGFWILLAVYMVLRFQEQYESQFWLCACFALGMGVLTKTVPLCLAPLLLLSMRKLKFLERLLGAVFLLFPVIIGLSVVYALGPNDIQTKVLGYRSVVGCFGFTGLFRYFGMTYLSLGWSAIFEVIYGIAWVCAGFWLWSRENLAPKTIVMVAVVLLIGIPAIGPGYCPQYAHWFLPLLVLLYGMEDKNGRVFLLVFYAIATVIYTVEYAFNFNTFGAFFLEIIQTRDLVQFGLWISTPTHQMFLFLPLWLFFIVATFYFGLRIKATLR